MSDEHKPRGWGKFDALAKKIVAVPKDKVDKAIARQRKKRTGRPQKK